MADWGLVAIRFALYADLMLLVGLAAFPLYSFTRRERDASAILPLRATLTWLTLAALVLSVLGFAISIAAMMGIAPTELDWVIITSMGMETTMGAAWGVRVGALAAVAALLAFVRQPESWRLGLTFVGGTIALMTLAWSGHAGATEGSIGTAHRISDAIHLVAAAVWIGGIIAFFRMLTPKNSVGRERIAVLSRALANFARVGTAAVFLIVATGLFNALLIAGTDLMALLSTSYGQLLAAKIILFILMLILAAQNRWTLAPSLKHLPDVDEGREPLTQLRFSLALEAGAATAILALVAWLGILSPTV